MATLITASFISVPLALLVWDVGRTLARGVDKPAAQPAPQAAAH